MLYLGAAAGTTVSHVADIVGPSGCVYAVEFAHRPGRDLINMAKSRTNVIPIIEDARHPLKYRMLVGMVDTVFADVAQPDQVCGLGNTPGKPVPDTRTSMSYMDASIILVCSNRFIRGTVGY